MTSFQNISYVKTDHTVRAGLRETTRIMQETGKLTNVSV